MRTKGSCRFESYHKIEVWNDKWCCWTPIQKSYATRKEAQENAPKEKHRIVEVTEKGNVYA